MKGQKSRWSWYDGVFQLGRRGFLHIFLQTGSHPEKLYSLMSQHFQNLQDTPSKSNNFFQEKKLYIFGSSEIQRQTCTFHPIYHANPLKIVNTRRGKKKTKRSMKGPGGTLV
jgi:hypothetical protein